MTSKTFTVYVGTIAKSENSYSTPTGVWSWENKGFTNPNEYCYPAKLKTTLYSKDINMVYVLYAIDKTGPFSDFSPSTTLGVFDSLDAVKEAKAASYNPDRVYRVYTTLLKKAFSPETVVEI